MQGSRSFAIPWNREPALGPKALVCPLDFTQGSNLTIDLLLELSNRQIDLIKCFYVDNSANNSPVVFTFGLTGISVQVPANVQGIFPCFLTVSDTRLTAVSNGNVKINAVFVNVEMDLLVWPQGVVGSAPGSILASSNVAFFVATPANGGSDNNPGTSLLPFATFQKAVNTVALYNYGGIFTATITGGAGTFAPATHVNLPELVNYPANKFAAVIGAGITTVIHPGDGIGFLANGSTATWEIDDLTVDASLYAFFAAQGAYIFNRNGHTIWFKDSTNGGNNRCFNSADGGLIQCLCNADLTALTKMTAFLYIGGTNFAACEYNAGTITLPAGSFGGGWWIENFNFPSVITFTPGSVVNFGSWAAGNGGRVNITAGTVISTLNGILSDIPGVAIFDVYDKSCMINNANTGHTAPITDQGLTPATLAAGTTNNYTPAEPNEFLRLTANAANSVLTGLAWNVGGQGRTQADGDKLQTLVNLGTGTLTLNHQDAGSFATNRFLCSTGANIVLTQNQSAYLLYDGVQSRWLVFPMGGSPAGSDSMIQYNATGSFGAQANFEWDYTLHLLKLTNTNLIKIDPGNNLITSNGPELVMEETGDALGICRLHIRSRTGLTGALFENASLDLVDFGFLTSSAATGNIRFEHRSASLVSLNNTGGEFQIQQPPGTNLGVFGGVDVLIGGTLNNTITGNVYLLSGAVGFNSSVGAVFLYSANVDSGSLHYHVSSGSDSNITYEHRGANLKLAGNTNGEFQWNFNSFVAGNTRLVIGNSQHAFYDSSTAIQLDWNSTNASKWSFGSSYVSKGYTVATLPTGVLGARAHITDGDAGLAWGATAINSGAGATKYAVWYNGTNWTITGK